MLALRWLAWLSPPTHWFNANHGETRVAIPTERLAPPVPVAALRAEIEDLDSRISDLESASGNEDGNIASLGSEFGPLTRATPVEPEPTRRGLS